MGGEESGVAEPPARTINYIDIINILPENQGSVDFSPPGPEEGIIKPTDKAAQPGPSALRGPLQEGVEPRYSSSARWKNRMSWMRVCGI